MHYAPNLVAAFLPSIDKTVRIAKEIMYAVK
jgi:pyruvate dehydrogenase E1 component beta subunit